jgi:hypothetical protein
MSTVFSINSSFESETIIQTQTPSCCSTIDTNSLRSFLGKTVNEFLTSDSFEVYESSFFVDEPPLKLAGWSFQYNTNCFITVYPNKLTYQPKFSEERKFSLELFKKEEIGSFKVSDSHSFCIIK